MRLVKLAMLGAALGALVPAGLQAQYWGGRGDRYAREVPPPPPPPRYYAGAGYPPPPPRYYAGAGYPAPPPPPRYRSYERPRCNRGAGGTIIGAIAGGLLGNSFAGRGDRGFGTVVGAGAGALAGREIDRNC